MRQKQLISFPRLNERGGDLSKKWYVEYSFYLPNDPNKHLYRNSNGLCSGTADERRACASAIIRDISDWLTSGRYLTEKEYKGVRSDETWKQEAQNYAAAEQRQSAATLTAQFLEYMRPQLRPKTYETYKSKLKYLAIYFNGRDIVHMQRADLLPFFQSLANEKQLSRLSIEKYMQITRKFYEWLIDAGEIQINPCTKIPKFGKIVDCSPVPMSTDLRARLRAAIEPNEPMLWLACEMQYYCAVRPGTELRLLRVGDIDRENAQIKIRADLAKNKKTEVISLPTVVLEQMEKLGIFAYPQDFYIFGQGDRPSRSHLGHNTMRNRFNRYREQLGISTDIKFYSWKHSGAISAAENGMPILQLKDHLRHSSVATTEIYLRKRMPKNREIAKYIDEIK